MRDLDTLLKKHFTPDWRENEKLKFFKELFEQQNLINEGEQEESDLGEIDDEIDTAGF